MDAYLLINFARISVTKMKTFHKYKFTIEKLGEKFRFFCDEKTEVIRWFRYFRKILILKNIELEYRLKDKLYHRGNFDVNLF